MPDEIAELEGPANENPETQETQPEGQQPAAQPKTEEWKTAMAELTATVTKAVAPKEPEPEKLSEDQVKELWAIYDPEKGRPDFMKKFFRLNPEATPEEEKEARQLFKEMQEGFMKQAVTGARNYLQIEMAKFRKELEPIHEHVSNTRARETKARFHEAFPVLADARFEKIVALTAKDLADKDFPDEPSYFKALAERAAETIKAAGVPDFDLAKPAEKTKTPGSTPRLPRTSVGGTGGAGGGNGQSSRDTKVRDDASSLL